VQGVKLPIISGITGKNFPDMPGTMATPLPKPILLAGRSQMAGDFTTWREMFGNGAKTGMMKIIINILLPQILPVPHRVMLVFFVAEVGSVQRTGVVPRSVMDTTQGSGRPSLESDL